MAEVLIIYSTREGQTQKIAQFLQERINECGVRTHLQDFETLPDTFDFSRFDSIVIGASIHMGSYPKKLSRFLKRYSEQLNSNSTAFFSVCMTEAGFRKEDKQVAQGYINILMEQTGWSPELTHSFAGALPFSKYSLLKRFFMGNIMENEGQKFNTNKDYEFTDWTQVELFARKILLELEIMHPAK